MGLYAKKEQIKDLPHNKPHSRLTHEQDVLNFGLKINGVEKIKPISNRSWLIQTATNKDLRPEIFRFAVDNNLTVLSLQKKDKSLEDVFRELTK